jgi:hypothetical protein
MLAGGEGVGSELRPFIATPPAVMLAKERFVPAVTEAMVTSSRCRIVILMQRSKAWRRDGFPLQPWDILAARHVARG